MEKKGKVHNKKARPTLKVRPRSHQPTKAEMNEDVTIPTTPEHLAKCLTRTVRVEEEE